VSFKRLVVSVVSSFMGSGARHGGLGRVLAGLALKKPLGKLKKLRFLAAGTYWLAQHLGKSRQGQQFIARVWPTVWRLPWRKQVARLVRPDQVLRKVVDVTAEVAKASRKRTF
jgi:hypothetical protein